MSTCLLPHLPSSLSSGCWRASSRRIPEDLYRARQEWTTLRLQTRPRRRSFQPSTFLWLSSRLYTLIFNLLLSCTFETFLISPILSPFPAHHHPFFVFSVHFYFWSMGCIQNVGILQSGHSGASNQSLSPVTVKQLLTATQQSSEDIFRVDGVDLHQITIVGQIVSVQPQSTNIVFTIDDSSGRIVAKIWLSSESQNDYTTQKNTKWRYRVNNSHS